MSFTLLPPSPTSFKEEAVLFKVELSSLPSPLLYTDFLKLNNKFITVKTLYYFYILGALT